MTMKQYIFTLFFALLSLSSFAQKRVIIEKFTSSFCGSCPNAALIIKDLQQEYPGLIWVSHHKPTTWTDYDLDNDRSDVIWDEANIFGTPLGSVDRTPVNNNIATTSGGWENLIIQQFAEPAYAEIEITNGIFNEADGQLDFEVNTTFSQIPPSAASYRLSIMIVEDSIVGYGSGYDQSNYFNDTPGHPLEGMGQPIIGYVHNNIVRTILDDTWGTPAIIPDNPEVGQTYTQTYTHIIPDTINWQQSRIVAMVTKHDDNSVLNRQVLNANERYLRDFVVTSANEPELAKASFWLSPNPTQERIFIQNAPLAATGRMLNGQGQKVMDLQANQWQNGISVAHLPKGIYYVQLMQQGEWQTQKLVVQ